jgi:hypothetical protein
MQEDFFLLFEGEKQTTKLRCCGMKSFLISNYFYFLSLFKGAFLNCLEADLVVMMDVLLAGGVFGGLFLDLTSY